MLKRCFLFIVAVDLLFCLCGCSLDYDYNNGKTVDSVYYVFNNKNKTCFAAEYLWDGNSTEIVIQDEVDGYKVTQLGGYTGRGVPTPFGIYYNDKNVKNITLNESRAEGERFVVWESKLPEAVVVHYINFDIKIGKYVNCINEIDGFDEYQKIDQNNYLKPLVTFSVSPDNKSFQVNDFGMINYVKEGNGYSHKFDYAAAHDLESYDQS